MRPIVVVGSYVKDLSFSCERLPVPGETVLGGFFTGPGGKGSNQAVAASRAGIPTRFVGAVGRDDLGREAGRFLRSEGIETHLRAKSGHPTAAAAVLVDRTGQNQIVVAIGAGTELSERDVPRSLLRGARVVVCQNETNNAVNLHTFRMARALGVLTLLNPAPMVKGFDRGILSLTDILVPNEHEFEALTGHRPGRSAAATHRAARSLGVATVIVTLGSSGCLVSAPGGWERVRAHKVRAVDTTGAGDAFVGGLAAGLIRFGGRTREAAQFANATAGLSVTKPGTAPSMPRLREIEALLGNA
jgi:ribokinase